MKKFKIASIQMNALKGDLKHNLELHIKFIRKAAKQKCRLVMFPELSVTAHYGDDQVVEFAEPANTGSIFETMANEAEKYNIFISYGFCELAHGTHYNSQALVGPTGLVGVQRKVHASSDEYFSFRMGQSFEVFDLGFCKVGTLICYDSDFSEAWRVLALKEADIILLPHAWRIGWGKKLASKTTTNWLKSMLSSLPGDKGLYTRDNAVFSVFANQVDFNGHSTHGGGAYVIDPLGKVLAKSTLSLRDQMITAELDLKSCDKARLAPFYALKYRRPETYRILTESI